LDLTVRQLIGGSRAHFLVAQKIYFGDRAKLHQWRRVMTLILFQIATPSMTKLYRSLRPLGWLVFALILAVLCALIVLGTVPTGAAQPPV
jgi:hypothetical protein